MIRLLLGLSRPGDRAGFWLFIGCVVLVGIFQGLVIGCFLAVIYSLFRGDIPGAMSGCLWLLAGVLVNGGLQAFVTLRGFSEAMRVMAAMHQKLGDKLVTLSPLWFDATASSVASGVAVRGTLFVARAMMDLLVPLIINLTTPLTLALMCLGLDWRLGGILLAGVPFIWLAARWGGQRNLKGQVRVHQAARETDTRLLEFIDNQMALRQAGLSGPGGQGYAPLTNAINRQWRAGVRALWSSVLGLVTQSLAVQLIFGLAIWLAVWLALSGQCDPVWAVVLIGLAAQFSGPLKILSELETAFKRARIELQEVSQLLALPGLAEPAAPEALSGRVDVAFEQVSFRYPSTPPPTGAGDAAWLFDRLDLHIPQGSLTALVGPSGCGKTTLTRLMARFCEPQQGRITLGGVDIRQLRYQDLMSALSLVFQDVCLFDDTLEANIRIGNPAASQQQLLEVAALARVTDIVARLPGGWQSPVGEGGRLLSGGERQRVSVARALLKGAPLLLLDEATAAQDPLTAMAITQAISALKGQVTIIVIAHQLATIRSADRIVFLDNGRVCEQGTHAALIARNGRYAHFWHSRGRYHHPDRKNGDMTCG